MCKNRIEVYCDACDMDVEFSKKYDMKFCSLCGQEFRITKDGYTNKGTWIAGFYTGEGT